MTTIERLSSMNEQQTIAIPPRQVADEGQVGVIDLAIVLAKHKKRILVMPLMTAIVVAAASFALPNIYKGSAKILPPQQAQSGAGMLLAQIGSITGGGSGKNAGDLYVSMLKSRTIADNLIKRFDLMKLYDTDSKEKARKILEGNTAIAAGKEGLITIDFEDENKELVARLANGYVDELMKLTRVLAVTEAGQRRMFFERQLELCKNNLAKAEMTFKEALDLHGVISVDGDSRAIVETLARVRAQISAKEIQLSAMQAFVTANHQDYKRVQEELHSLRTESSKLQNGRPDGQGHAGQAGGKQVGLENIKILREVKYYQMLYELLSKQYESARLDEAKDSSIIQVLDAAVEPERKSKPSRAIIALAAAILAMFGAIGWAFMLEAKQKAMRVPEQKAQWEELQSYLRR